MVKYISESCGRRRKMADFVENLMLLSNNQHKMGQEYFLRYKLVLCNNESYNDQTKQLYAHEVLSNIE